MHDADALEERAAAAAQAGDRDTAIEIAERLFATEPNANHALTLADALSNAGRHAEVVTLVDQHLEDVEPSDGERRGLLHFRLNALLILNWVDSQEDELSATVREILDLDEAPGPEERLKLTQSLFAADDLTGARAQLARIEPSTDTDLQDSIAATRWAVDSLEGTPGEISDDEMPHVLEGIELVVRLRGDSVVAALRRGMDHGLPEMEVGGFAVSTAARSVELGRTELAEQLWWFAVEISPDFMLAPPFIDAGLALGEATYDDRFALLEKLKARRPGDAPLVDASLANPVSVGVSDAERGRFAHAAATADAVDLTAHGILGIGLAQMSRGELPKAARTLEMVAEADPELADHPVVRTARLMIIGSGLGDVEKAKEDLTSLRAQLPDYLATYMEAGIATAEKRLDDAEHLYRAMIEQADAVDSPGGDDVTVLAFQALGNMALERGDFDAAHASFTAASDRTSSTAIRAQATALAGLATGREAMAAKRADLSQDIVDELYDEGVAKVEEGAELAVDTPFQAMTKWMLGVILWGAGRPDEALLHLRPVVDDEEVPDGVRSSAAITTAHILLALEDPDAAIHYYERAAQLTADDGELAEIAAGLGRSEIARGRYDEAVAALRAGVDRSPTDPTLWRVLGQAYSAATRHEAATYSYRRAWRIDGSTRSALGVSEQLLLAGRKDDALTFLNSPKVRDLSDEGLDLNRRLAGGDGGGEAGDEPTHARLPPWPELWLGRGWVMRIAGLVLLALIVLAIVPYVFQVEDAPGFGWLQPNRGDPASAVGLLVLVALLVLPYGLKLKLPGGEIEAGPTGPGPDRPEPKFEALDIPMAGPIGPR